ncbi:hypothetical protein LGH82_31250 [Mesorhizobium sp. PAMC28654]|uniref:hypothetical protein n=1 Tax=Mesorhizobium sp. PAMC28654 TaxID=2880934 RepID=UPI001D0A0B5A|nr:hypothetical protein [Mesorhizobium sp. PAMC28654]UDL89481.1 hypothetical protein LGH82_31250 [Mesorhizobium sp. PAMC28654]
MRELRWTDDEVVADFIIPGDEHHVLRVLFTNHSVIIRILDEMPLSTENESTPNEGLVPHHFAYRIEGAVFEATQSETWKFTQNPATHYRFVTGWTCLDVLSAKEPTFQVVKRTPQSR